MLKRIFISVLIYLLYFSSTTSAVTQSEANAVREPIKPIFQTHSLNKAKVLLGEKLFNDVRLSADDTLSCASCHRLGMDGADGKKYAEGINGQIGPINTPTVFNAVFNVAQFWDGRAHSLQEQALGPVENPIEMGAKWPDVVAKLANDRILQNQFMMVYRQPISVENITDAIAEFERTLITPNSPFDQYLLGNSEAISEPAKEGYALFKSYGCISCHHGVNVGGNMFHKMGALKAYYSPEDEEFLSRNLGRFNLTQDPLDRYVFKVPSLRLVTQTAPYFHDGSAATLEEAIKKMARYQLLREISDVDVKKIIAFLESLAGQYKRVSP